MSLASHYASLDRKYGPVDEAAYADLVVPNGNADEPFHRWFHLKEGFSSRLLDQVISDAGFATREDLVVLDPFSGGGTTVVSGLDSEHVGLAYGIERNPFLHLVGKTKALARRRRPTTVNSFAEQVVTAARAPRASSARAPALSTFSNTSYFSPGTLRDLLKLRYAVDHADGSGLERDIARVALAATLEPASALRRDGRALRYEPRKVRVDVWAEFLIRMRRAAADIACSSPVPRHRKAEMALGDGRDPSSSLSNPRPSLILFSPPYPNNIDYTEVYKLETWFLGLVDSQEEFRRQRLVTLRSHPSVQFPDDYPQSSNGHSADMRALLAPLIGSIPAGRFARARERLVRGYFEDMLQVMTAASMMQTPGSKLVYVVANSLHGNAEASFLIAADTMIAAVAESVGYHADNVVVARRPARRREASGLLRESVVFLTRI